MNESTVAVIWYQRWQNALRQAKVNTEPATKEDYCRAAVIYHAEYEMALAVRARKS